MLYEVITRKGAKIQGAVALDPPHHLQGREALAGIETQRDIGLVVAEIDIVARPVFLSYNFV